jgi:hypothetical protein
MPLVERFQKMNPVLDATVIGAKLQHHGASVIGAKPCVVALTWQGA